MLRLSFIKLVCFEHRGKKCIDRFSPITKTNNSLKKIRLNFSQIFGGAGGNGGNGGNNKKLFGFDFDENNFHENNKLLPPFYYDIFSKISNRKDPNIENKIRDFKVIIKNGEIIPSDVLSKIIFVEIQKSTEMNIIKNLAGELNNWYGLNYYFSFVDIENCKILIKRKTIILEIKEFKIKNIKFIKKTEKNLDIIPIRTWSNFFEFVPGKYLQLTYKNLKKFSQFEFLNNQTIVLKDPQANQFANFLDIQIEFFKGKTRSVEPSLSVCDGNISGSIIFSEKNLFGRRISIEGEVEVKYPGETYVQTKISSPLSKSDFIRYEKRQDKDNFKDEMLLFKKNFLFKKKFLFDDKFTLNYFSHIVENNILKKSQEQKYNDYSEIYVDIKQSFKNIKRLNQKIGFIPEKKGASFLGFSLDSKVENLIYVDKKKKILMKTEIKHFYLFDKKYWENMGILFSKRFEFSRYYLANLNLTLMSKIQNDFEISMIMILNLQKQENLIFDKGLELCINLKNNLKVVTKLDFAGKKSIRFIFCE
jgi:hypothetical protein